MHLNPDRARLVRAEDKLESYRWSSYPAYLKPRLGPVWLRTDRLMGEYGKADVPSHRRIFAQSMEELRSDGNAPVANPFGSGWRIGAEDFVHWLTEKLGRRGVASERARERRDTDEELAERLVREGLQAAGWTAERLGQTPKGHPIKVALARKVRQLTPMTRAWIAKRLHMGSTSYVSNLLSVDRTDPYAPFSKQEST